MLGCKSSPRWNLQGIRKDDRHVTHAALKTVAAFFNTESGDPLIGVHDDRKALGSYVIFGAPLTLPDSSIRTRLQDHLSRSCLRVHDIIVRRPSGGVCGSSLPEVLEAAAEQAAAEGDDGVGAGDGPAHAGALEPCADLLASGLDDARRDAQALGAELRIAHAVSVPEHIVNAPSRLGRGLDMDA